jgi:hypothetical protein
MSTPNHILAQEGILMSFSIAKKVTIGDIKRIQDRLKKNDINPEQLNKLLRQNVIEETQKAINNKSIPGLIVDESAVTPEEKKRITEFTYFASVISKKIADENIDKYHACYIINAIISMLGLNEKDFENFHKKFSKYKNEDNNEPEDDDDEFE